MYSSHRTVDVGMISCYPIWFHLMWQPRPQNICVLLFASGFCAQVLLFQEHLVPKATYQRYRECPNTNIVSVLIKHEQFFTIHKCNTHDYSHSKNDLASPEPSSNEAPQNPRIPRSPRELHSSTRAISSAPHYPPVQEKRGTKGPPPGQRAELSSALLLPLPPLKESHKQTLYPGSFGPDNSRRLITRALQAAPASEENHSSISLTDADTRRHNAAAAAAHSKGKESELTTTGCRCARVKYSGNPDCLAGPRCRCSMTRRGDISEKRKSLARSLFFFPR